MDEIQKKINSYLSDLEEYKKWEFSDAEKMQHSSNERLYSFYKEMMSYPLETQVSWNKHVLSEVEIHHGNPVNQIINVDANDLTTQGKTGLLKQIMAKIHSLGSAPVVSGGGNILMSVHVSKRTTNFEVNLYETFLFVPLAPTLDDETQLEMMATYGLS